jgi:hypothetical protein
MHVACRTAILPLGLFLAIFLAADGFGEITDLLKNHTVLLEQVSSKSFDVSWVGVYQEGDSIDIRGIVKKRASVGPSLSGHVDLAVLGPNGDLLRRASTSFSPLTVSYGTGQGSREGYFSVHLRMVPPQGTVIRVAHHSRLYSVRKTFDCGENAALPYVEEIKQ